MTDSEVRPAEFVGQIVALIAGLGTAAFGLSVGAADTVFGSMMLLGAAAFVHSTTAITVHRVVSDDG